MHFYIIYNWYTLTIFSYGLLSHISSLYIRGEYTNLPTVKTFHRIWHIIRMSVVS